MLNLLTFFPTFDVMWFVADQADLIQLDCLAHSVCPLFSEKISIESQLNP